VTFEPADVDAKGWLHAVYHDRLAYNTEVDWGFPPQKRSFTLFRESWSEREQGFLRWPRRGSNTQLAISLLREDEAEPGVADAPEMRWRFLLTPGTYRIRPGESLVYYRRKDPDGSVVEASINVQRVR